MVSCMVSMECDNAIVAWLHTKSCYYITYKVVTYKNYREYNVMFTLTGSVT